MKMPQYLWHLRYITLSVTIFSMGLRKLSLRNRKISLRDRIPASELCFITTTAQKIPYQTFVYLTVFAYFCQQ